VLSRVAESLYWTARYVERAENVSRLVNVHFDALLDRQLPLDSEAVWRRLVSLLGEDSAYREHYDAYTAAGVTEFLLWHPENPNAARSCVRAARDNARSVREQLSTEMWQVVNTLSLEVLDGDPATRGLHTFSAYLRDASHAFQGVAAATMLHGEGYEFVRVGTSLERAGVPLRVAAAMIPAAQSLPDGSQEQAGELAVALKSCGAFDAFLRAHQLELDPELVATYIVGSPSFPRATLACLTAALGGLRQIVGLQSRNGSAVAPERRLARLVADAEFAEPADLCTGRDGLLGTMLRRLDSVGSELARAFFSTQVLAAPPRSQEAQQQQ
jgi:uncharacterized alpha-E superfamily protein